MELDHNLIGSEMEPFLVEVEKGAIRKFAESLEDDNPIYYNIEAAIAAGYRTIVAPTTFPTTFRLSARPFWLSSLRQERIMAGEQSFTYHRPIYAGDVLTCRFHLKGVEDKVGSSGRLQIISQEMIIDDLDGKMVARNGRGLIYKV